MLAINPTNREVWFIENSVVLPLVLVVIIFYIKNVRLSNISYLIIFGLFYMHQVGAHYMFENVPFNWFNNLFGFHRNNYDRVGHFLIGLLAYPMTEVLIRFKAVNKKWFACFTAVMFITAIAAFYEIYEWINAINVDPVASAGFMGSQGDFWDTPKDMLMDFLGGILGVIIYLSVYRKNMLEQLGCEDVRS